MGTFLIQKGCESFTKKIIMKEFYFNDPLTLDFQLDYFIKQFLGK